MAFLLFINRTLVSNFLFRLSPGADGILLKIPFDLDRLVDSPRMKRALEAVYSGVLPKGTFPFVYLR
jgi:hypothetical protein